jgi:hypothetical protein
MRNVKLDGVARGCRVKSAFRISATLVLAFGALMLLGTGAAAQDVQPAAPAQDAKADVVPTPPAAPSPGKALIYIYRFSLASQAFWLGKGWIFKAWRVYPSDVCFGRTRLFPSGLWFIVRMSPPSYPSAWLLPSRARFRFTWCGDCSAYAITIWGNSLLPS